MVTASRCCRQQSGNEMQGAIARMLPDGNRLHLQHGPIDLIVEATGTGRQKAYARTEKRFASILDEIVSELCLLRRQVTTDMKPKGSVAGRMYRAAILFGDEFVTPMAAVAGAVADEIISVISSTEGIEKAYVNNGGDTGFYLDEGQKIRAVMAADMKSSITIRSTDPYRGIATSGWRGRSFSLGIADAVSVVAKNAAMADVAATLIANAVDLPGHPAIKRQPAIELSLDSDLGERLVTTDVGPLGEEQAAMALAAGLVRAEAMVRDNLIAGAVLFLAGEIVQTGKLALSSAG